MYILFYIIRVTGGETHVNQGLLNFVCKDQGTNSCKIRFYYGYIITTQNSGIYKN